MSNQTLTHVSHSQHDTLRHTGLDEIAPDTIHFRKPTLGVLVQGTGWGAHAAVAALPHGQPLHLAEAALLTHALLVHALHWL